MGSSGQACPVKMVGYWPSFLCVMDRDEVEITREISSLFQQTTWLVKKFDTASWNFFLAGDRVQ